MRLFPAVHRSRARAALALIFAFLGLVAASVAALSAWYLSPIITSMVESVGLPASVGAATTLAITSLVLACLGVIVAAAPLPRRASTQVSPSRASQSAPPTWRKDAPPPISVPIREQGPIPAMSVYVDAENSPFSDQQLSDFFDFLDREIGKSRADRIYYMDANRGNMPSFRGTYSRGGFRLVDVPHVSKAAPKRSEGAQTVNAVDVALAMDVIERALLGPAHQTIILVTADRDYFPLIGRLKELGHSVQMWARSPSSGFIRQCTLLGVSWKNLDKEIPKNLDREEPSRKELPATQIQGAAAFVPEVNEVTESTLRRAIEATLEQLLAVERAISVTRVPGGRYGLFKSYLGNFDQNILREIGYDRRMAGWDRFQYWIAHLQALGMLAPGTTGKLPQAALTQSATPESAAQSLFAFVREVAAATTSCATQSGTTDVRYLSVADSVNQHTPNATQEGTAQLRLLIQPDAPRCAAHVRFFCSCARALGLVDFGEDDPPSDTMHQIH